MRIEAGTWFVRGAGFALGVGLVLLLGYVALRSVEVLLLVFLAVLLGAALEPVVGSIRDRTGIGRGLGILVVYACFLLVVVLVAIFIVPAALSEMGGALGRLPAFFDSLRAWTQSLRPESLANGIGAVIDAAEAPFRPGPPPSAGSIIDVSLAVAIITATLVTLLFLVFFWLTERPRLQRYALAFVPLDRRAGVRDAWNEVETRLGLWVRGQLTLMSTIGLMTAVAYTVIGLPAPLLLALIAAIAEVIPLVGPVVGAVPALLLATTVSPEAALFTLVAYVILQAIEGNVLVPIVMRNSVGLSPFVVLVSILIGSVAGGILGAVVSVPLVAGIEVVLERLQAREVPVPVDPAAAEGDEEADQKAPPDAPGTARKRRQPSRSAG